MKLASIGSGTIVENAYAALKELASDQIELVGAYSRNEEKAKAFADKMGVSNAWWDLDELFNDPKADTIYIASPNSLHYPQAKKALEAGKNVILEKPFAGSLEQAEDLFKTAEKHHVMIFEAITSIHTKNWKLLKENLKKIGAVRMVTLNFSQYSSRYGKYLNHEVTNVFDPKMEGGALVDINLYNIYLCVSLFGMPETIHYYPNIGWNGIDTSGVVLMDYKDFQAICIGCKDCSSDEMYFIQGDHGTLKISGGSSGKLAKIDLQMPRGENGEEINVEVSVSQGHHMKYEFDDFARAIETQDWSFYEKYKKITLEVMELLDRCKKDRDSKQK